MATYVSDATVLSKIKNLLKKAGSATIPTAISGNVTTSNQKAYDNITAVLSGRGFSEADIAGWDRGAEFNLDLACWWAINDAGVAETFDHDSLSKLDRRIELETCQIRVGGALKTITAATTTTDFGTNKSYGNRYAFGTALDYTNRNMKPNSYKPVKVTELEG